MSLDFGSGPPRRSSITLVVTFVLGVLLGSSLTYSIFDALGVNFAAETAQAPEPAEESAPPEPVPAPEPPPPVIEKVSPADVDGLWPARHLVLTIAGPDLTPLEAEVLAEYKPGAILLREENIQDQAQTLRLAGQIKAAAGLGAGLGALPLIAVAQEGGLLGNPLGVENAPNPADLGKSPDPALARDAGRRYGRAARDHGAAIILGPILDIFKPGTTNEALRPSMFSDDPNTVTMLGLALTDGIQDERVLSVVKYYPGAGAAVIDDSGGWTIEETDLDVLGRVFLPFATAVRRNVAGVLIGHIAVPGIERRFPERPATFSAKLVRAAFREQWKYEGVLIAEDVTDAIGVRGQTPEEAVVAALAAGCDAVIAGSADPDRLRMIAEAVATAAASGVLSVEELRKSKDRLDEWQAALAGDPATPDAAPRAPVPQPQGTTAVSHVVEADETLVGIARKHGVSVSDLRAWNPAAPEPLKPGTTLAVYVAPPKPDAPPEPEPETAPAPAAETAPAEAPAPSEPPPSAPAPAPEEAAPAPPAETAHETPPPAESAHETPPPAESAPKPPAKASPPANSIKREHTVADGETLFGIARLYGLTVGEIRDWNGLADARLKAGQKLDIYLPAASDAGDAPAGNDDAEDEVVEDAETPAPPQDTVEYDDYTVSPGDSLRKIAVRFKTTEAELIRINNIENPDVVQLGRKLKVPRPAAP